jgi:hypothetical protein
MRYRGVLAGVLVFGCGLLLVRAAGAGDKDKELPTVNEQVLKFAESNFGKQVGNGECWTLADQALASAKAKRPGRNGYKAYQFGRELKADETPLPGDIVQFEMAKFVSKKGGVAEMLQHTAIVAKVTGAKFEVLHQNWNNSRDVSRFRFDLTDLKNGTVTFFRPQAGQ